MVTVCCRAMKCAPGPAGKPRAAAGPTRQTALSEATTADEWHFNREDFRRADHNADGVISRSEFLGGTGQQAGPAYRAGYERGRMEGLQAGREDGARNRWDLEGQRELESADSGYAQALGSRSEYQAGYRDGFRSAYPEGFGR
jgi:hypothetical protein